MRQRILLAGSSRAFTGNFKKLLEDCGLEAIMEKPGEEAGPRDLSVYEVRKKTEIRDVLAAARKAVPFLIFSGLKFDPADLDELRERGLMGVITPDTTAEDTAFLVNKSLFYDKMMRRNPRVPVNIQVDVKAGMKTIKTFSSLLSRDGMFIVTLSPLDVNTVFDLEFWVPGIKEKMRTKAKVLYNISINKELNIIANLKDPFKRLVSHPGMAVFFMDLPQEDRESIDSYIKTIE